MATKTAQRPVARPAPRSAQSQPRAASREVTKPTGTGVSAEMADAMRSSVGKGVSTDHADNLVPLIYVLQPLSPQCLKGHEKQIDGAEAGNVWLRNDADNPLIDGDEGMLFQPCHFSKDWIEWLPDRGGFVARHETRPEAAEQVDAERDDGSFAKVWQMPSGNRVVETRYHVGYVLRRDLPPAFYTIPLSSTGHTVSKSWMFAMNSEQFRDGSGTLPSFGAVYRLRTTLRSKNDKNWYQYEVTKECRLDDESASDTLSGYCDSVLKQFQRGLALHNAFEGGEKRIENPQDDVGGDGGQRAGDDQI